MPTEQRILVIGDTHIPCVRRGYLEFCQYVKRHERCNLIVHIGDVVDEHAVSPSHLALPDAAGTREELQESREIVAEWYGSFPRALVCIGNHDDRPYRAARAVRICEDRMRTFNEVWSTPRWTWDWGYVIDGIYFTHRTNNSGQSPAFNAMRERAMPVVLGHHHSCSGVKTLVNPERRLFGVDVGAGCDDRALAFRYFQHSQKRSVMSCATIINGMPHVHVMPCSRGEQFHDSNFST